MKKQTKKEIKGKSLYYEKLLHDGKYFTLRDELEQFLEKDPDNVDTLIKIAVVYKQLKNYSLSESMLIKAIQLKPNHPYVYSVYGELLFSVGLIDRALKQYDKALSIDKNYYLALYGMGQVHIKNLDYSEAIECFKLALESKPDFEDLIKSLGAAYKLLKLFKEAADSYKSISSEKYKDHLENYNNYIESLYYLGDKDLFYEALNDTISKNILSIKIASISSHAAVRYEKEDKYSFCKKPLDYIYKRNLIQEDILNIGDMRNLIEFSKIDTAVSRRQDLLERGKQTSGNIFGEDIADESLIAQHFLNIISNEVEKYKLSFSNKCELISSFPEKYYIKGWLIEIENDGFLKPHIHDQGWISGSIYLNLPQNRNGDEGNIEFSTEGRDYSNDGKFFPKKIVDLNLGDIVLFPSSLFHSTIPFNSNQRRITLAFDVIPEEN
tara:strand:- start:844 stop:2157 length:1314 start_codon:yes stop_codon:yes gene_type:complete